MHLLIIVLLLLLSHVTPVWPCRRAAVQHRVLLAGSSRRRRSSSWRSSRPTGGTGDRTGHPRANATREDFRSYLWSVRALTDRSTLSSAADPFSSGAIRWLSDTPQSSRAGQESAPSVFTPQFSVGNSARALSRRGPSECCSLSAESVKPNARRQESTHRRIGLAQWRSRGARGKSLPQPAGTDSVSNGPPSVAN